MDHQTAVNGAARDVPARALARGAAGIAHDLVGIAELQAELLGADVREVARAAARGIGFWLVAAALFAAMLPVAIAGLGLWLANEFEWSPAVGLLVAALGATVLAAAAGIAGRAQFRSQAATLERSQRELRENIKLLKRVLMDYANREQAERADIT